MKEFSKAVCERIGNYVYVLKDPRNSTIFYIGKGVGNRVFQHISDALESSNDSDKLNLIREIMNENLEVEHFILRHNLTKEQAFEIESACIDLLGLDNLTNSVKGHNSWERGLKTVNEVVQHYDAKTITITEPSIIININRLYKRFMTEDELYNSTKQSWVVGYKKKDAKYVIASYRGLVREVYEIENWYQVNGRWGFNGKIANKDVRDKYLNNSLEDYIKKGNQNPIRYTF
ncbi:hypothetical protein OX284_013910 [Flavobacterium sp. SUN046]|uniref:LEM-3-like GIY-YIG domain-containing protein n=1 Tax=Flavobacterium sp. SUN046 TaxID=3002440 RepID=UPI002DBC2579|nr:hypothetical protein [Flavobacterium sp. SUN046]MEC4050531.1 hypothetical protein [Flavobacterium sp. SUN046]